MKRETILLPKVRTMKVPGKTTTVDREKVLRTLKTNLRRLPKYVTAFKEADNEGWQGIMDDLTEYVRTDPTLSKFIRIKDKDGVSGVSIGEPNWWFVAVVGSFAAGYAFGTLLYESGCADLSSTGVWDPDPEEDDECEQDPDCFH